MKYIYKKTFGETKVFKTKDDLINYLVFNVLGDDWGKEE